MKANVTPKDAKMTKTFSVENHKESLLPSDKKWSLVWNDEFDGTTLDTDKWDFRTYFWGKRSPTFLDNGEGVELTGESTVRLNMIKKDGNFFSPHMQTGSLTYDLPKDSDGFWPFGQYRKPKFMHKFGYYEIRCRLPKNDGWHAAFWLQSPSIGAHPDPRQCGVECDIIENYPMAKEGTVCCGCGWNGYGKDSKWFGHFAFPVGEGIDGDGWHYYGVDWSENGYIFYADGMEVGRQMEPECPASNVEQFILISTECHGYNRSFSTDTTDGEATLAGDANTWNGKPVPELFDAVLPDFFEVDFVRVYDQVKQ